MLDMDRRFTADDLTDAYWLGYTAAICDVRKVGRTRARRARNPIPRGWYLIVALAACLAFWAFLIWLARAVL